MIKNDGFFEKTFRLKAHGTDVKTEMLAGFTTFMTMAYILAVNPYYLSQAGMDPAKVFTATALSALIATLVMAFYAKLPFALAPGMGLNAFFAFTVVIGMEKSFQFALTAILLEGIIFMILTLFNVREAVINSIPLSLKKAISVGIGLFIAFIGLVNAGVIEAGGAIVTLGNVQSPSALLALVGIVIAGVLLTLKIKGALFIAILLTTLIGIPMGVTETKPIMDLVDTPAAPYFFEFVSWSEIFSREMFLVLFVFLFVDMFDTVGTLVGVATKADMLTPDGKVPGAKKALMADAVGTTVGAIFGTSTVTTYVESASGVAEGGRTGMTAMVTALLFGVALFFSPLFLIIPSAATAPALVIVGLFMMSPIKDIDFDDFTEAIPAFLAMIMMPLTYSIADGIVFGVIFYVALKALTGRAKEVTLLTWIISLLFILNFIVEGLLKAS